MSEWRPVAGFDLYSVSSSGLIRRESSGRVLKPWYTAAAKADRRGYAAVNLYRDGLATRMYVHDVVLQAFVGPRPAGLETNHRDGDKGNPALSNLEYVTRSENGRHAYRMHLKEPNGGLGIRHPNAKLTDDKVVEIRSSVGVTVSELSRRYGVSRTVIRLVRDLKVWKHVPPGIPARKEDGMTTHTNHPDIQGHGLADGCPKCDLIALKPFNYLDDECLIDLAERTFGRTASRSMNEDRAMGAVMEVCRFAEKLDRLGYDAAALWGTRSWPDQQLLTY